MYLCYQFRLAFVTPFFDNERNGRVHDLDSRICRPSCSVLIIFFCMVKCLVVFFFPETGKQKISNLPSPNPTFPLVIQETCTGLDLDVRRFEEFKLDAGD